MAKLKGNSTVGGASIISTKNLVSAIQMVDGHGSGIDADTLDGKHGSEYSGSEHNHDGRYLKLDTGGDVTGSVSVTESLKTKKIILTATNPIEVVPNSIKITNLDADKVDGKHVDTGNVADRIPVRDSSGNLRNKDKLIVDKFNIEFNTNTQCVEFVFK